MRFDKFTTKFQQALADAQSLALGNDHSFIEPVHLLAALLEPGGRRHRVPARARRRQRHAAAGSGADPGDGPPSQGRRHGRRDHVSRDLTNLLNVADKEAQKRGDQFIASEMFLLALR